MKLIPDTEKILPLHGGDIITASKRYGVPLDEWIDLSTGINPIPYPVRDIPLESFTQLPYRKPEFTQAVAQYYQADQFIAVAGTQVAIQLLPRILVKQSVLVPDIGYQEHAIHWEKTGACLNRYPALYPADMVTYIDATLAKDNAQHVVVINPNNPTGVKISPTQLRTWAAQLAKGSYLIVDEAFIDIAPHESMLYFAAENEVKLPDNVIVLRSFGKFFGLAGVRLGFVFAHQTVLQILEAHVGLWSINGPAQAIAIQALRDEAWQTEVREKLHHHYKTTLPILAPLLESSDVVLHYQGALFSSYIMPVAVAKEGYERLAKTGVLVRFVPVDGLRGMLRVGRYR